MPDESTTTTEPTTATPLQALEQDAAAGAAKASPRLWAFLIVVGFMAFLVLAGFLVYQAVARDNILAASWAENIAKALVAGTVVGGAFYAQPPTPPSKS